MRRYGRACRPFLSERPSFPSVRLFENVGVFLPIQRGFISLVLLQPVQIFEEKQPRRLFGIIQFRGAARFFPENIVNVAKGLLEHRVIKTRH